MLIMYSNKPYQDRLRILGLPSLEYRRERADMIQVYKILHGIDKLDKKQNVPNVNISEHKRTQSQDLQTETKTQCQYERLQ